VVVKRDFRHTLSTLKVRKQEGKEGISLLDDINMEASSGEGPADGGVWSSLSSKLFGGAAAKPKNGTLETVHVFSLATGHLYERMLKIMMLSVRKRTSGPVKFWLLENFLSPSFKTAAQVRPPRGVGGDA
jgi:UDP-glucose:glycoprotein glucosyltransferase